MDPTIDTNICTITHFVELSYKEFSSERVYDKGLGREWKGLRKWPSKNWDINYGFMYNSENLDHICTL